jgi:hypothetical protein
LNRQSKNRASFPIVPIANHATFGATIASSCQNQIEEKRNEIKSKTLYKEAYREKLSGFRLKKISFATILKMCIRLCYEE